MATRISVKNIPVGYQTIITNGTHAIVGDEPIKAKGTDLGLSPSELVLSGIAMCKATTVRSVARRNGWEIGNVDVELTQNVRRDRDRNLRVRINTAYQIDGDITDDQLNELIREADDCYVTRLVQAEWEFEESTLMRETENEDVVAA